MKFFLFSIVACIGLTAAAASPMPAKDQMTIMVYMNAKNNLDCDAIADLKEMKAALPFANTTVVAEVGRRPFDKCVDEEQANVWTGTLFFRIERDLIPSPKEALPNVPDEPSARGLGAKVDMGDPQSLRRFVIWAERTYPAKHYVLVIWGHGHGFRLQNANLTDGGEPAISGHGYRAVSFDDEFQSYLFTHDFQEALEGTPKLDVLAFDSCLMAGIETAYAVRKLSAVMVGSEELEPEGGWNYRRVLRRLSRTPNRTPRNLGISIVKAVRSNAAAPDNPVTLSAIDLAKVDPVVKQVSHLADALISALAQSGQSRQFRVELSAIRDKCSNYGQADGFHNPIDLINFIELLAAIRSTPEIQRTAQKLLHTFTRSGIVIDNYATTTQKRDFGSNGLTIYFPKEKQWYNNDPDDHGEGYCKCICGIASKHPVDFVCRLDWSSFLRVYFPPEADNGLTADQRMH